MVIYTLDKNCVTELHSQPFGIFKIYIWLLTKIARLLSFCRLCSFVAQNCFYVIIFFLYFFMSIKVYLI